VARLELHFTDAHTPELFRTSFRHDALPAVRCAVRGKTDGAFGGLHSFQWTPALRAMSVLLLGAAAWGERGGGPEPHVLQGGAGSAAASLDYAISKQPDWMLAIFGSDCKGRALARRCFRRSNSERKTGGLVTLALNPHVLAPSAIAVFVEGCRVRNPEKIDAMAERLAAGWRGAAAARAQSGSNASHPLLDLLNVVLQREIQEMLERGDIFGEDAARQTISSIRRSVSFQRASGGTSEIVSEIDCGLSSALRLGLHHDEGLMRRKLCARPLQCALPFILPAAMAVFQYLRCRQGYPFEVNYRYAYANELYRKIIAHELAAPPDLVALSLAPAANLMKHGGKTDYRPLMLLPGISHRLVAPRGGKGRISMDHGRYFLLHREPSTPEFYLDLRAERGLLRPSRLSVEHCEPDEVPRLLAQGDPESRAAMFFPHYDLNLNYNRCAAIDQPSQGSNYSPVVLFAHRSLFGDRELIVCLDVAIRDAWLKLRERPAEVAALVADNLHDEDYRCFLTRCCGLRHMRACDAALTL